VILFDDVTKTYASQNRPALDGVSLEIEKGRIRLPRRTLGIG
jgi:hypothetical protein